MHLYQVEPALQRRQASRTSSGSASSSVRATSSSSVSGSAASSASPRSASSSGASLSSSAARSSISAVVPAETVPPDTSNADTGSGAGGSTVGGGHLTVIVVCSVLGALIAAFIAWRAYKWWNTRSSVRKQLPPAPGSAPSYAALAGISRNDRSHSSDLKEMTTLPTSSSRLSFVPKQTHSSQSFPSAGQAYIERPISPSVTAGNGYNFGQLGSDDGGRRSHASNHSPSSNLGATSPSASARSASSNRRSTNTNANLMMGAPHMPYGRREIVPPTPLGPPSLGQGNLDFAGNGHGNGQGFGDVLGFRPDTFGRGSDGDLEHRARRSGRFDEARNSRPSTGYDGQSRRFAKSRDSEMDTSMNASNYADDEDFQSASPHSGFPTRNAKGETHNQGWRPPSQHLDDILRR